ncbi:MAG: AsnC family transcriptional regulator [Promethearchaeota archaeon]
MDSDDLKIILLLFINSRLTYREISEYLGLSVNAIFKRVQTLIDLGIIQRFKARIKPYALNAPYVFIFGESETQDINQTISDLGKHENTYHMMISSRNQIYIGALLQDIHKLDEYASYISQTAKINSPTIGLLHRVFSSSPIPYIIPRSRTLNLDKLDVAIIRSLHTNSRKPVSEIADDVNSTSRTVRRRLSRMIEEGLIELSIDFNPVSSNDIFSVFLIALDPSVDKNEMAQNIIAQYTPHIFFCWTFSNLPNLILCWVWCNTMQQLNDIIANLKQEKIESLISDVIYKGIFLDTWKEDLLYE